VNLYKKYQNKHDNIIIFFGGSYHSTSTKNTKQMYIADPEDFTIMIDHAIYAPRVGIQRDGTSLPGYIKGPDGTPMPVGCEGFTFFFLSGFVVVGGGVVVMMMLLLLMLLCCC
jgi:hypothetical protein